MRLGGTEESRNVEDRRGIGGGGLAVGGGIIGVIVLLVNLLSGGSVDTSQLPIPGGNTGTSRQLSAEEKAAQDQLASFSKKVLRETELVWQQILPEQTNQNYTEPTLVLFTDAVQTGCGGATSASGPFYCPADNKLYIDLSFYQQLQNDLGGGGDFAMAYVIAHEVGHHIQSILGTSQQVSRLRGRVSEAEYNRNSVKLELQADFLAGVWAHYVQGKGLLDVGDVEEAMRTASAIGDDRLTGGRVPSDNFTHGTSQQRMYWFKRGYETGDIRQGNTFQDPSLQ